MTKPEGSASAAEIRARLPHPVVDGDGHLIEYLPALAGYLRDEGVDPAGSTMQRLLRADSGPTGTGTPPVPTTGPASASPAHRGGAPLRPTPGTSPPRSSPASSTSASTSSASTSVCLPEHGPGVPAPGGRRRAGRRLPGPQPLLRRPVRPIGDRLVPVAAIPMHTPEEAVAALEDAVTTLSFKAVLLAGYVQRAVEGVWPMPRRGPAGSTPTASTARSTTTPSGPAAAT